jgi:hypothetical protein
MLADRLASLARHRRHVGEELERIERFLDGHPDLRSRLTASSRPHIVVDNIEKGKADGGMMVMSAAGIPSTEGRSPPRRPPSPEGKSNPGSW